MRLAAHRHAYGPWIRSGSIYPSVPYRPTPQVVSPVGHIYRRYCACGHYQESRQ